MPRPGVGRVPEGGLVRYEAGGKKKFTELLSSTAEENAEESPKNGPKGQINPLLLIHL
jgi:hypothetical protein